MPRDKRTTFTLKIVEDAPPRTRAECEDAARPCKIIRCAWHMAHAVTTRRGLGVRLDPKMGWVVRLPTNETCVMDVIGLGGTTLEEVARVTGVSRERIRQLEERTLGTLKKDRPQLEADDVHAMAQAHP